MLIICTFFTTQFTQGVFQKEVGDKVAYKITEACHDISVSSTTEAFIGCSNDGTIISNGSTIVVEVTEVTATELSWNTTNISPKIVGTCPSDIIMVPYTNFLAAVYTFLVNDFDIATIISTGVIPPIYFDPFEVPLFVDPKPQTWIYFDSMEANLESIISSIFSSEDSCSVDVIHTEIDNKMILSIVLTASSVLDPTTNFALSNYNSFSYNMTTGELLVAEMHYNIDGEYMSAPIATDSDYKIIQTAVPPDQPAPFNFLEFLSENKWYFIGGAGGIVLIGATVGIVLGVKKSKASTKKSTKKKPSKKKK